MSEIICKEEDLFYCDIPSNSKINSVIEKLRQYSQSSNQQVYILQRALGVKKPYEYGLSDVAYILVPKHPILLLNYGNGTDQQMEDYYYDFKEDLGHLSDRYNYDEILGRVRKWPEEWFMCSDDKHLSVEEYLDKGIESEYVRRIDLLISLLIGSINNVEKVGKNEPTTLLEKVKHKIILFDGKQSSFIYQSGDDRRVTIQGMAGTGKTELLLHKLKEIYSEEEQTRIVFTCFNKVLANEMKSRIPQFFDFMKVDKQIDWENRLHVCSSWGSAYSTPDSGLYRYICSKYGLKFSSYRECPNFNSLCKKALEELNQKEDFKPCFDYTFIDESQDFGENFFDLCEKVTSKTVYIAGDIFQNIYDQRVNSNEIKPDFLLNKCYRTDPKTLMFAHAVGMGLYEEPHINWLEDKGWYACGYQMQRKDSRVFQLTRNPLRRFEDLEATNTIELLASDKEDMAQRILDTIKIIRESNSNVEASDIGIVILADYNKMCEIADKIVLEIYQEFRWFSTKGYETKTKEEDTVYISNVNNIKGLEFPFVICVVPGKLSDNIKHRNAMYMALTRSFLTSYFIVDSVNEDFITLYSKAIKEIAETGCMDLVEPSEEEKMDMINRIEISLTKPSKSVEITLNEYLDKTYGSTLTNEQKQVVIDTLVMLSKTKSLSEEKLLMKAKAFVEDVLEV